MLAWYNLTHLHINLCMSTQFFYVLTSKEITECIFKQVKLIIYHLVAMCCWKKKYSWHSSVTLIDKAHLSMAAHQTQSLWLLHSLTAAVAIHFYFHVFPPSAIQLCRMLLLHVTTVQTPSTLWWLHATPWQRWQKCNECIFTNSQFF